MRIIPPASDHQTTAQILEGDHARFRMKEVQWPSVLIEFIFIPCQKSNGLGLSWPSGTFHRLSASKININEVVINDSDRIRCPVFHAFLKFIPKEVYVVVIHGFSDIKTNRKFQFIVQTTDDALNSRLCIVY
jgi:hypothetical protein